MQKNDVKILLLLIFICLLGCLGLWIKNQLGALPPPGFKINIFKEGNFNYCMQDILWFSWGLVGAGIPLFAPKQFLDFSNRLLTLGSENKAPVINKKLWEVRLIGAWFFIPTLLFIVLNPTTWNQCIAAVIIK